jgi:hypothetical protein
MSLMFLAFAMTLHEATLEFEDDSLTERALAMFARTRAWTWARCGHRRWASCRSSRRRCSDRTS